MPSLGNKIYLQNQDDREIMFWVCNYYSEYNVLQAALEVEQ